MLSYKKLILIAIPVLVLGIGGFVIYNRYEKPKTQPTVQNTAGQGESDGDEKDNPHKENQITTNQPPQPAGNKKSAKPSITYAGQYDTSVEVGAYVPGVFEDGGSCTLTLQRGDKKFTAVVNAVKNVSSVDCPVMSVPRSSLDGGEWQATVAYSSNSSEGTSDPRPVGVR